LKNSQFNLQSEATENNRFSKARTHYFPNLAHRNYACRHQVSYTVHHAVYKQLA